MFKRAIHTLFCFLAAAFVALSSQAQVAPQTNPNFEYGVDRRGGDYRSFDLQFDAPGLAAKPQAPPKAARSLRHCDDTGM